MKFQSLLCLEGFPSSYEDCMQGREAGRDGGDITLTENLEINSRCTLQFTHPTCFFFHFSKCLQLQLHSHELYFSLVCLRMAMPVSGVQHAVKCVQHFVQVISTTTDLSLFH